MMKTLKTLIVLLVLSLFMGACSKDDDILLDKEHSPNLRSRTKSSLIVSDVKVMTYNTHLFLITRFDDAKRQTAVVNFINQHKDNDIVVMQEVWADAAKREIASSLKSTYPYEIHTETSGGIVGNGLLIVSKFPINKSTFETFGDKTGSDWFSHKGFWELEIATKEGAAFYLYATHLQASNSESSVRAKQLNQILAKMNRRVGYPVMLAGDLNIPANTNEYRTNLTTKFSNLKDPVPSASTAYMTYDKPINTLAKHFDGSGVKRERLDYILASDDFSRPISAMYRPKYQSTSNGRMDISDHYPFESKFSLKTSKTSVPTNVYNSAREAEIGVDKMKADYGNGVSALTVIHNNTSKFLTFKSKVSYDRGGFHTPPPSVIPPGKFAGFLAVHPQGEALGVDNRVDYYIGGKSNYFSATSIVPWGAAANELDGRINASYRSDGDGKSFTHSANSYTLSGTMGGGTSPRVRFTISD